MKTRILPTIALLTSLALPLRSALAQEPAAEPPPTAAEPSPAGDSPAPLGDAAPPPETAGTEVTAIEPAPAADTGGEVELSAAELAELGLGGGSSDAPPVDTALKLYGFMDFGTNIVLGKNSPWRGSLGRHPAFYIGSFNLYLSKNMTEKLRTFGEVRFTFLPNGSKVPNSSTGDIVSTGADDYADFNRQLKWGGIEIERVYFEWLAHRLLTVRVGVFLTPYGIWNVDHGSPTIVPVQRPFVIGLNFFPERQTGFELLGRAAISSNNSIGYHLTLSNGFGPVTEYRDYDDNKAIGGRAYWSYEGLGEFKLGGSFFYGRDTSAREIRGLNATATSLVFTEKILQQSDVLSLAADVQWKYKGLLVQSEFITQQRKFTDDGRTGAVNPLVGRYLAPRDDLTIGVYGMLGYRFEWFGVMPYMVVSSMNYVAPDQLSRIHTNAVQYGLNIRPIDVVTFKVEGIHSRWPDGNFVSNEPINYLMLQLAWAF